MKKIYIKPTIQVVVLQQQGQLLMNSGLIGPTGLWLASISSRNMDRAYPNWENTLKKPMLLML